MWSQVLGMVGRMVLTTMCQVDVYAHVWSEQARRAIREHDMSCLVRISRWTGESSTQSTSQRECSSQRES